MPWAARRRKKSGRKGEMWCVALGSKPKSPELWERWLSRERRAQYLGVAVTTTYLPQPKRMTGAVGPNLYRYDRHEIDLWMESRPRKAVRAVCSLPTSNSRKL